MKVLKEFLGHIQYTIGDWFHCGFVVKANLEKAVYWFHKAVENDNAEAQYYLGLCYSEGEGIYQNSEQAVYWFYKAAEQGHAKAQFSLGLRYADGEGVDKDLTQAVYWYSKAAEQGNAGAQNNLGVYYANGEGVPQDLSQAVYWYRKAAEQGNENAQNNLKFYDNSDSGDSNALNTKSVYNKKKKESFIDRFIGIFMGACGTAFGFLGFWIAKGLFDGISFYVLGILLIISFVIVGWVLCNCIQKQIIMRLIHYIRTIQRAQNKGKNKVCYTDLKKAKNRCLLVIKPLMKRVSEKTMFG